jgi:2-dehydro-3-deoxyphosphooctonate aldolase (KDO 8-P synthase)
VVEGKQMLQDIAGHIQEITTPLRIPFVFKASYRKANRSSAKSFTGLGDETALLYLKEAGEIFGVPLTTDIHAAHEASMASSVDEILQIPAFLCRQTDLLESAAHTGKTVNIKKGQFLSPEAMQFAVEKVRSAGNNKVMLTERGTMFGYQDLIVDYRGIPVMRSFGTPVIMDCTHSLQQPNQGGGVTGGRPEFIELMARAALVSGADGLFIETHPQPAQAKSDGANMLPLPLLKGLLENLVRIYDALPERNNSYNK